MHPTAAERTPFPNISVKDLIYWFAGTVFIFFALSVLPPIGALIFGDLGNEQILRFAWLGSLLVTGISGLAFLEVVNACVLRPKNLDWPDLGWAVSSRRSYSVAAGTAVVSSVLLILAQMLVLDSSAIYEVSPETMWTVQFWAVWGASNLGSGAVALGMVCAFLGVWFRFFRQRFSFRRATVVATAIPAVPLVIGDLGLVFKLAEVGQAELVSVALVIGLVVTPIAALVMSVWLFERYGSLQPACLFYVVFSVLTGDGPSLYFRLSV